MAAFGMVVHVVTRHRNITEPGGTKRSQTIDAGMVESRANFADRATRLFTYGNTTVTTE